MSMSARVAAWIVGFLFVAVVAYIAYSGSNRPMPITDVKVSVISPSGGPIMPGERAELDVRVFYRFGCEATIHRQLYDIKGTRYALQDLMLPPGPAGLQASATPLTIPARFAIGEARYTSQPEYACNWFQRWFWPIHAPERIAQFVVEARS